MALLAAVTSVPAAADDLNDARARGRAIDELLYAAAQIEWVFARCDVTGLDAAYALSADAALAKAGSAADIYRYAVEAQVASNYGSRDEACADLRLIALLE